MARFLRNCWFALFFRCLGWQVKKKTNLSVVLIFRCMFSPRPQVLIYWPQVLRGTRNLTSEVRSPGRSDRTDPTFELGKKLWPHEPKLQHIPLPYGENDALWVNVFSVRNRSWRISFLWASHVRIKKTYTCLGRRCHHDELSRFEDSLGVGFRTHQLSPALTLQPAFSS